MTHTLVAMTTHGPVVGQEWGSAVRFAGIQFADRIDGPGRLLPPRHPSRWDAPRLAHALAGKVPQVVDPSEVANPDYHQFLFGPFSDVPMTEAGLFLNLWTPSLDRGAKRPVMVWLHGGGFSVGSPTRAREDGAALSAHGDVVVVAPSHRLGANGYLYLDRLTGGRLPTANLGLLDILFSLQWVAENIDAFGGDPDNVTVFGESGGAMKVSALLAMPAAKGLMHKAICQGGYFAEGFRFGVQSPPEASDTTERLLDILGLAGHPDQIASLSMQAYVAAQQGLSGGIMAWRPVVDGVILPVAPPQAIAHGTALDIPLLIGTAAHEADFFVDGRMDFGGREELRNMLGADTDTVFDGYAATRPHASPAAIYRDIMTDYTFRLPSIRGVEARLNLKSPSYMYRVDWERTGKPPARAAHGAEVPFVFGTTDVPGYTADRADALAVSAQMQNAWLQFARTGNPNHPGIPHLPPYDRRGRATIIFDNKPRVEFDPGAPDRVVWQRLWEQQGASA